VEGPEGRYMAVDEVVAVLVVVAVDAEAEDWVARRRFHLYLVPFYWKVPCIFVAFLPIARATFSIVSLNYLSPLVSV